MSKLESFGLGLIIALGFGIGFTISFHHNKASNKVPASYSPPYNTSAIIRLHDSTTGEFFCSGIVISNSRVLTAAHCVLHQIPGDLAQTTNVNIRVAPGLQLGTEAKVIAANDKTDYALIAGDFKDYAKMRIETSTENIIRSVRSNPHVVCGYPIGGVDLVCTPFTDAVFSTFKINGHSFMYPGMSGGPLIDTTTNTVVGVNYGVDSETSIVNPLIEMFGVLRVTP